MCEVLVKKPVKWLNSLLTGGTKRGEIDQKQRMVIVCTATPDSQW